MCLEFLCSWCHQEEDGPEHHRPSHHTSMPPASKPPINGTEYPARGESPSKPDSGRSSNVTDTWNDGTYPATHDPPSKRHSEPYSGNKNPVVSGVAVNNGDTKRKDENPKTSSMVFNGDKDLKAVHPRPSAPLQQSNLRRGADSNLMHTGDGARRNGHMRKDEEEDDDDDDDDEEEEEVSKEAQTKNRRY